MKQALHRMSLKKYLIILFLPLALGAFVRLQAQKTVFIIVDGIAADMLEKANTPNLNAIKNAGGYTRSFVGGVKGSYSQTPTISAVGYNSVLTGTWVNKHNVWDNDIKAPNYHYPTIFRLLKDAYPQKTTAIFSSWQDNRTKLVGDKLPATGNYAVDIKFDGLELDTLNFPHDEGRQFMSNIDEAVALKAASTIADLAPDLSWVYLEFTDDMGHRFGDSPQMMRAIELADTRVGYIWKAVQNRIAMHGEDWLVVVTTDHGRDAKTGKGHGGQTDRERSGWIMTNAAQLNAQFATPQSSIVDIMPAIARFMGIALPAGQAYEVDGIPFIGPVSFINPGYQVVDNTVNISWQPVEHKGQLEIYLSATNRVKTGGEDAYKKIKTVPIKEGRTVVQLPNAQAMYKIVLKSKHTIANQWVGALPTPQP